jgi:hypothetical protein
LTIPKYFSEKLYQLQPAKAGGLLVRLKADVTLKRLMFGEKVTIVVFLLCVVGR